MVSKRVAKGFALAGLFWVLQVLAFIGTCFVIGEVYGWNAKAPDWINVWGIVGVMIPTFVLFFFAVGFIIREVWLLLFDD